MSQFVDNDNLRRSPIIPFGGPINDNNSNGSSNNGGGGATSGIGGFEFVRNNSFENVLYKSGSQLSLTFLAPELSEDTLYKVSSVI